MKKNQLILCFLWTTLVLILLFTSSCSSKDPLQNLDLSSPGNTNANLNNLGLSVTDGDSVYYVASENEYDILYCADPKGTPIKALSGLTGYIQFLNIADNTFYYVGITFDDNGNPSASIFSAGIADDSKECIYNINSGYTVTYMTVIDDMIFYAASAEDGRSRINAINLKDKTEARLVSADTLLQWINIVNGKLYYINNQTIYSADINGKNREKLYSSEQWLSNLIVTEKKLYFTQTEQNQSDTIYQMDLNSQKALAIYSGAKWISAMNCKDNTLYFADNSYDDEGNFISAEFYQLSAEEKKAEKISTTKKDYSGIEVGNDLLIYHLNDEQKTAKVIPLQ